MKHAHIKNQATFISEPWRMLISLLIAQLMVAFIGRSIGPLGVLIGEDLSLSKSQIGMLPAALFMGQAIVSVPAGYLTDRLGSRRLLLAAAFMMGIGYLFTTFLTHFGILLVLVVIGGLGYGSMHPITNRGIIYWFPQKQRGTAMGIKQMGITAGAALASLILLPLSTVFGWRPVLLIACVILLFGGVMSYFIYRDPPQQKQSNNQTQGLVSFYKEMFKMLKNKRLLLVSFSAMGLNGSQMCLTTYIVLFSYEKLGISLFLSGMLLVISEVFGSFGRIAWGIISDRIFNGKRVIILMIITGITAVSSLTVAFISSASFWLLAPIIALFGFSAAGFNGIWMNLASELVPPEKAGISSGISLTMGSTAVIIVPPLFGFLVDFTGDFMAGWLLITGLMVMVFFMLSALTVMNQKQQLAA
ncbi:MFS transporter [Bacillus sp. ISL-47]|uniref:MFS transporter n=1 Tax=Bacillus sp. ISL-47 TaxID=2819130 RepID=UPI001BEBE157|nr:MFS transporter [Bacillus sp. ISL-47]MBT2686914.1 MFS transporter [Bacillus sp. ISL-47]MBT2710454.1 MFS transporter [Pseudomonas sp. ISL-84]